MTALDVLGEASVDEATLRDAVARLVGGEVRTLGDVDVEPVAYDLEALTTAARWWVRGTAVTDGGARPFTIFVKVLRCWSTTPAFQHVPEPFRDVARRLLPWRTELETYQAGLGAALPPGLGLPRLLHAHEVGELGAALWLEAVEHDEAPWTVEDHAHAARLLGRLAASPAVAAVTATTSAHERTVRSYLEGRVALQLVPAIEGDDLWAHPLVSETFAPDLRDRLREVVRRLPALAEEVERLPHGTIHGDACTRNLLRRPGRDEVVLVDLGFWGRAPLGFDLSQLLVGEVQTGERSADLLPVLQEACLPAYLAGLADVGEEVDPDAVARGQAVCTLLFAGLSAPPLEHLGLEPTPDLLAFARGRAASLRWILDRAGA